MSEKTINTNLPFTLKDLKNAIPKQYFHGNLGLSLFYFFFDFLLVGLLSFGIYFSIENQYYYLIPLFSVLQGSMFWSIFVIGHDCGHASFSGNSKINYFFGLISHSFILVPYHSWKRSHQKHHLYHGNLEKDESHVALTKKYYRALKFILRQQLKRRIFIRLYKLCMFFPIYLFYNDHPNHKGKIVSHFEFNDIYFRENERLKFKISILGYFFMVGIILIATILAPLFMIFAYFIPWVLYNMTLHFVTYLHHNHEKNPWYYNSNWTYLKGALSTTDYDYGFFGGALDFFHHNIERYHVVHHLFPSIPHYYLKEATQSIVPILGDHYHLEKFSFNTYPRIYNNCRYVNDEKQNEVAYYFQAN